MTQIILTIIATALLSSIMTLTIAHLVMKGRIKKHYEAGLAKAIEQFKQEVGPDIEARVKKGVVDGVKSLPSREILRDTTRTIAKTGLDIMGDSFKLATRPRSPTRRPGPTGSGPTGSGPKPYDED